jgi:alpha-glucosidase
MIRRFVYSPIYPTGATVLDLAPCTDPLPFFTLEDNIFHYSLAPGDRVYGLGETVRGMNKRGWVYESYCTDEPFHTEDKKSIYGAHNFILVDGEERFGAFFDTPGRIAFDIGYTNSDVMTVAPERFALDLYIVTGDSLKEIVREFRTLIGTSYVPPLWAFGYGQSRWGYCNHNDITEVADKHDAADIPLDMIYLDIDYLDRFKDFTVNGERFPNFKSFVSGMRERGIHLIPIIDAAVKKEEGYSVYDEGHKKGYFCKDESGEDYVVGVWPGRSVLPDFLNPEAAQWFGMKYRVLTEAGIDGFWNDMNEPALFYSEKELNAAFERMDGYKNQPLDALSFFGARETFVRLANSAADYKAILHDTPYGRISHDEVHNLYGYKMTASAAEALKELCPDGSLLFSRASYIGAHRCAGVWTGDNHSWWSHILLSLQQMPGLNMCGFLYSGSDIGGFNGCCTRDLLIRWMSFALFTPLMRNHSAAGTRRQEATSFGDPEVFRHIIRLRYRLIPYLYSEFRKAAATGNMYFRPLRFDYEDDRIAAAVEDQLMVGDRLMIAPIYVQNAVGRTVYLPERMTMIRMSGGALTTENLPQGRHYIDVPLGDVVFFTRGQLPLADAVKNTAGLNPDRLTVVGEGAAYEFCD